jgi:uncharacterized membrane protein YeiH
VDSDPRALDYGNNAVLAALLGTISAVGGGTVRAVLLAIRGFGRAGAMALGAMVCFAVRVVADWQNWNLPKVNTG